MAFQKRLRYLVLAALFICLAICTFAMQQYTYTLLLAAVGYWLLAIGIFGDFSDADAELSARPFQFRPWMAVALIVFALAAFAVFWGHPARTWAPRTAEDIQLTVDRSGAEDAGLHQQFVSETVGQEKSAPEPSIQLPLDETAEYVLNTNTRVFHNASCTYVGKMADENKSVYTGTREDVLAMDYEPCGHCNP